MRCFAAGGRLAPAAVLAAAALALATIAAPGRAHARPPARELVVGAGAHLAAAVGDSCRRNADQVECTEVVPFAGFDLAAQAWLGELLAFGARVAGSRDLDESEGASSSAIRSWDPEDQWLWRLAAELRVDPPLLPPGLWVGAEGGVALLRESWETPDTATTLREEAATRAAPLLGVALGWDFWLSRSLTLTPELRGEAIFFGKPAASRTDLEGRDYGASTWLDLSLRLSYVF